MAKRVVTTAVVSLSITCLSLLPLPAIGHPGRTDSSGGHHNRRTGGYHQHGFPSSSSSTHSSAPKSNRSTYSRPTRVATPRKQYRSTARTVSRANYRTSTPLTIEPTLPAKAEYDFPDQNTSGNKKAKQLFEYAQRKLDENQREKAIKYLRRIIDDYPKADCHDETVELLAKIRISEPFRIWTDLSGKNTIEAKAIRLKAGVVTLETRNGRSVKVAIEALSSSDTRYLQYLFGSH